MALEENFFEYYLLQLLKRAEQSRAGIGSSDVVVLVELNDGVTLCDGSGVTCACCLDAICCHDIMFQCPVVWVTPLTVDVSVAVSCMTVGVVSAATGMPQPRFLTNFLKLFVKPHNYGRPNGDVKPSSFLKIHSYNPLAPEFGI
jgi:hypothetical protein